MSKSHQTGFIFKIVSCFVIGAAFVCSVCFSHVFTASAADEDTSPSWASGYEYIALAGISRSNSIPKTTDPDATAFIDHFNITLTQLDELNKLIDEAEYTSGDYTLGTLPGAKNTYYVLNNTGGLISISTSPPSYQDTTASLNAWVIDGEVIYAEKDECLNPAYLKLPGQGSGEKDICEMTNQEFNNFIADLDETTTPKKSEAEAEREDCEEQKPPLDCDLSNILECIDIEPPVIQFPSLSTDVTDYTILVESRNTTRNTDFKTLGYEYDRVRHTDVGLNLPSLASLTSQPEGVADNNIAWTCTDMGVLAAKKKKIEDAMKDANTASTIFALIPGFQLASAGTNLIGIALGAINAATYRPTPQECQDASSFGSGVMTKWVAGHYILETPMPKESQKYPGAVDNAVAKFGITFAKPTDLIQFRNTMRKDWYTVEDDLGKFAPSYTNSNSEVCKVTTTYPTVKDSAQYTRLAADTSVGNAILYEIDCRVGQKPNGTDALSHEFTIERPLSGSEYPVRDKNIYKIGAQTVQNDVGKKFVQEIKDASPTWAYPTAYTCLDPNANPSRSTNDVSLGSINLSNLLSGGSASLRSGYGQKCNEFGTSAVKEGGKGWSAAQVNVPYNYSNRPTTTGEPPIRNGCAYPKTLDDDADSGCTGTDVPGDKQGWPNYGLVYAGENFRFGNDVIVNPRNNPDVDDDEYATYTKKTRYQIVSFATTADSDKPNGYGTGTGLPCSYYQGSSMPPAGRACLVLSDKDNKIYNPNGSLGTTTNHLETVDVIIDDLPVGSKICFAAAVFPADSHDKPDTDLAADEAGNKDGGAGMKETGTQWAYGAPYCVTVAKKPNFQVWGGGVYTSGGMNTSQSPKLIGGIDGSAGNPALATQINMLLQSDARNSIRTVFGSWSEWEVVSLSGVRGFGSGAAFGYSAPVGRAVGYGGGMQGFDASRAVSAAKILCATSKMILANNNCDGGGGLLPIPIPGASGSVGGASVQFATMTTTLLTQMSERYTGPTGNGPSERNRNAYHIDYYRSLPTADVTVPSGRVYVYDLRGRGEVTLAHNITYADSNISHNDGPNTNKYKAISELPQALIFADDLIIAPEVTNVDSWIIIQQSTADGGEGGTLDTCGQVPESADDCSHPLTVNGPVFVNQIALNRTYGALPGTQTCNSGYVGPLPSNTMPDLAEHLGARRICDTDAWVNGWKGSVAPAERFILRIDTFYWAYSQASISPKAVSVHTYEPSLNF